jgi:hypothetical protein
MRKLFIVSLTILLISTVSFAQSQSPVKADTITGKKEIDPSNPTNLYTQVNTSFEYQTSKPQNLYGLRINVQKAFNPDNLLFIELPMYYNDRTGKFGQGDMRIRYYSVVKRRITKRFIAIVPFVDIGIPTGLYKNGLGGSVWSFAGGIVGGFVLSKKLSLFPGVSYVHLTKPATGLIADINKFSADGIGLQFNASYKFNKTTFMFINPTPSFINTNGNWKAFWSGDLNLNKIIKPNKLKMNIGWSPNFTARLHTIKLGTTFFL